MTLGYDPQLAPLITQTANNLGISPSDLGTAMSYETNGTMNQNLWGGSGGKYLGLIQFGPEEQQKYGVTPGMPLADHMKAVENYLRDRGVKPGMGMLDLYSTINAGSPGHYNASDANNGGAPGTVADKVATQMVGHRARANALLGNPNPAQPPPTQSEIQDSLAARAPAPGAEGPTAPDPNAPPAATPPTPAPATPQGGVDSDKLAAAFMNMRKQQQQKANADPVQGVPISVAEPAGLPAARALSSIMQRLSSGQA